ncbi:MAG: hypothetical protein ACKV2V_29080 [Blastocatellia bacterium]
MTRLLGLAYARHGRLAEAETQFRTLARQNPASPLPRQLSQSLRTGRK